MKTNEQLLKEAKEKRGQLYTDALGLVNKAKTETRANTADEEKNITDWTKQADDMEAEIQTLERNIKLERAAAGAAAPKGPSANEERDLTKYSLMKVVRSKIDSDGNKLDGIEMEMHQEAVKEARSNGQILEGVGVPGFVFARIARRGDAQQRSINVTTAADGGAYVQTDVSDDLITALRPRLVLAQAGAQTIGGLLGNLKKVRNGGMSIAWETEQSEANDTTPVLTSYTLSPKRASGIYTQTKQWMLQTSPSVQASLEQDIIDALAAGIDAVGIKGGGTNEPVGIIGSSISNIVALGATGGAPTLAMLLQLEELVALGNADLGSLAMITNPKVRRKLKSTLLDAGSGQFVWPNDNKVQGYNTFVTTNMPSNMEKSTSGTILSGMIFGNFNDLEIAQWGGVDITVDPLTKMEFGQVRVGINAFIDIGIKRLESFAICKDITTT